MALDKFLVDPILNTYKGFIAELEAKNCTGENYQKLVDAVAYLEQMANEYSGMNGFMDFNARIMTENLYGKMGDYYARALSEKSDGNGGTTYDDSALLDLALNALRDAIALHKRNYEEMLQHAKEENAQQNVATQAKFAAENFFSAEDKAFLKREKGIADVEAYVREGGEIQLANNKNVVDSAKYIEQNHRPMMERIVNSIQAVIDLGEEEGMTYPRFLTLQLERGLFDATATQLSREIFEEELRRDEFLMCNRLEIAERRAILDAYNQLTSQSKLGAPEIAEWNLVHDDICREYEIPKLRYKKPLEWGINILRDLSLWSLAYSPNAMWYEPWAIELNEYKRRQWIIEDQKRLPGIIKAKIFQLKKYFDVDFVNDFFTSEGYLHAVKSNTVGYSQPFIDFLVKSVLPQCVPCRDLASDLVRQRDDFHTQNTDIDPDWRKPGERIQSYYKSVVRSA